MTAIPKEGSVLCKPYLDFQRRQNCAFHHGRGGEAHHFPGKGRSGVTRDDKTIPVCRECHMRCEGQVVTVEGQRMKPIPAAMQELAVRDALFNFVEHSTEAEFNSFATVVSIWKENKGQ